MYLPKLTQKNKSVGNPIVYAPELEKAEVFEHDLGDGRILPIRYGYVSLRGKNPRPPHKPNQDSLLANIHLKPKTFGKKRSILGCFDGHGPYGEHASHFCRMKLGKTFMAQPNFEEDPEAAFEASFIDAHEEFCQDDTKGHGIDPTVSGTT